MLRTRLLTGPGLFRELEGDWKELDKASRTATPFQTYQWHRTWYRHFGGMRKPLCFAVREGNDLVGIYPMVRSLAPWRTLRPMGIGPSDYLHPLIRDGYEDSVSRELGEQIASASGFDLIDLHQLRETQTMAASMPGKVIDQAVCLVLDLPKTYDAYLQQLGKSLRYDVRKLDKSLFSSGRAQIELVGKEDIDRGMDILFHHHRLRWRKRGLPGAFLGKATAFHRDWARQAAEESILWLSILRVDGNPIGAIYAMGFGGTAYYYQAGFDPAAGSVSPGTLLVAETIRRAIGEGKEHFDFMRGDEPYKRRWKPQHAYRNVRILVPSAGMMGAVGSQWNLNGSRIENKLRARLEGRSLI